MGKVGLGGRVRQGMVEYHDILAVPFFRHCFGCLGRFLVDRGVVSVLVESFWWFALDEWALTCFGALNFRVREVSWIVPGSHWS